MTAHKAHGAVEIELLDLTGRKIWETQLNVGTPGIYRHDIPVAAVAEGTYLVMVSAGGTRSVQELMVR